MAAPPPTQEFVNQNFQFQPTPPLIPNQPTQYPSNEPGLADDSIAFKTPNNISSTSRNIRIRWQVFLDTITPHYVARWIFSIGILCIFMLRIVLAQGWYVICYALAIYYLNLFIEFLSPKIDPAFLSDNDEFGFSDSDSGPMLPTRATDEFKPFIRRLPEFKFWLSGTISTLICLFLTMFEVFDLPVFWPILLIYFILLLISTMRQQIKHMIRYGYVPWDKGKKKYGQQTEDSAKLYPTTI